MAPPAGTLRVGRYFLVLLAILAVLYAIVFWPGQRNTPKLGIDLVGGTQVVFTAKTDKGGAPPRSSMNQARQILSDRVNGTGVTQATVVVQGDNQLVVSIPGQDATDVQKLGAAAVLNFRGLVAPTVQVTCTPTTSPSGTGTSSAPSSSTGTTSPPTSGKSSTGAAGQPDLTSPSTASGAQDLVQPLANRAAPSTSSAPKTTTKTPSSPAPTKTTGSGTTTPSATPSAAPSSSSAAATKCVKDPIAQVAKAGKFAVPLSEADYDKLSSTNKQLISAALANFDCSSAQDEKDEPKSYYVACDTSGLAYLLGTVVVPGKQIANASAVAPNLGGSGQTEWTVSLDLKSSGQSSWADYTSKHNIGGADVSTASGTSQCGTSATPCADYVAFTLDGSVISAPVNVSTINGGSTEISGGFTSSTANDLANQLKYGALPLSFDPSNVQSVSATLGTEQLKSSLLAGGIGLVLVIIYSLIYYRALGLVTIASLMVSGALTYGALVMLATQIGFTLSLAGIAGFIVSVGITADSFVVFFERIKDEVHEGRSVRVAIPRAWVRARRTILSADTVSFLAAAVLYYFTTDEVRGFAFTLGLSTLLDLIVVFLFTHPLVSWLSRLRTFGSARFTGLDAVREGHAESDAEPDRPAARARARRGRSAAAPGPVATLDDTDTDTDIDIDTDIDDTDTDTDADEPSQATAADLRKSPRKRAATDPGANRTAKARNAQRAAPEMTKRSEETPASAAAELQPDDELSAIEATEPDEPPAPRRRVAPEPGSAAERAAARRARMRAKSDDEGQS